jgi:hypothetical protein
MRLTSLETTTLACMDTTIADALSYVVKYHATLTQNTKSTML